MLISLTLFSDSLSLRAPGGARVPVRHPDMLLCECLVSRKKDQIFVPQRQSSISDSDKPDNNTPMLKIIHKCELRQR